jgi:phosphopantothenoylcysteine decarboxylase/phosphopantothenate--cysteine ligase
MRALKERRILLGVSGGIAAYKSCLLARALIKAGAKVQVVMTTAAQHFVTPLTFEALTESPVWTDSHLFATGSGVTHVELARNSDLVLIAPATATTIARLAGGFADNLLSATVLAATTPVLLVPSMHTGMWQSHAVQRNLEILDPTRFHRMQPDSGELASGDVGPGRFPEIEDIVDAAAAVLCPQDMAGRRILVTAGPTREHLDPVRALTNPSSGRMGIEVARAALARGASVHLLLGPSEVRLPRAMDPSAFKVTRFETCVDLLEAARAAIVDADGLVMAAAPADERPVVRNNQKLRKKDLPRSLDLEPTPDVLLALKPSSKGRVVVGFAAETADIESSGLRKLEEKGLDLLFANPVGNGRGFVAERNEGLLLGRDGWRQEVPLVSKAEVAHRILDRMAILLEEGRGRS